MKKKQGVELQQFLYEIIHNAFLHLRQSVAKRGTQIR